MPDRGEVERLPAERDRQALPWTPGPAGMSEREGGWVMKMAALVVLLTLSAVTPAAAAAAAPGPSQSPPVRTIANPPPIAPGQAVAWLNGLSGRVVLTAQAEAPPVAAVTLLVAGLLLMVGWLFGARLARLVGQWLVGAVLLGYFLVMAAPRLVTALEGLVTR